MSQLGATATVYKLLQSQNYKEAIAHLNRLRSQFPSSRAANSLLGFAYYQNEQYNQAADIYADLTRQFPTVKQYKLSFVKSLYKGGKLDEAERQCFASRLPQNEDDSEYVHELNLIHSMIKYDKEELSASERLLKDNCINEEQDVKVIEAAILFKEKQHDRACEKFVEAIKAGGYQPHIAYNIALCHFMMRQYVMSLKSIEDIQEKAARDHEDEFGIYAGRADSIPFHAALLKDSMLIEALNLKAAIEFSLKNNIKAREALQEMPQREEYELDAVSLHNTAILNIEENIDQAIEKLFFLVNSPPFPKETVGNLLLLLCKTGDISRATELLTAAEARQQGRINTIGQSGVSGTGSLRTGIGGMQAGRLQTMQMQNARMPTGIRVGQTRMGTGQGQIGSSWGQYGNQSEVDPWLAKFIRAQSTSLASQEEGYSLFFDLAQKQLDEVKKYEY